MGRSRCRWTLGALLFILVLVLTSSPASAQGCAWENCYVCVENWYLFWTDAYCSEVHYGEGRLCCQMYPNGNGTFNCRSFDQYCYGIVVRDIF
jgi:hypothetical protein